MPTPKVNKFAKVLFALHQQGLLGDPELKTVVGTLVRESTETPHVHCTTDFRSINAGTAIEPVAPNSSFGYHSWCRSNLRHEHMVPTSVRMKILLDQGPNLTEDFIAQSLECYGLRATIHIDEDNILNAAGLAHRMPDSFWLPGDLYMNPRARYIATGLNQQLVARQGVCWFADNQEQPPE